MKRNNLTDIVHELKDLADQLDHESRQSGDLVGPSSPGTQLREIEADLCLLSSLEWSHRNGTEIIAKLRKHGEFLEEFADQMSDSRKRARIHQVIFELLQETPAVMDAMVSDCLDDVCLHCDRPESPGGTKS